MLLEPIKASKFFNLYGANGLAGRIETNYTSEPIYSRGGWITQWLRDDERFYYIKDHLGSKRITVDQNNEITNGQDYLPLGSIFREYNIANSNEKYDFTEKERDTETGLNYFGARYYDSDLGRWTSVDPLAILRPGLSSYNYVQNNPLFRIDPFGLTDTTYTAEIKNDIVITSNDQANSPLYYYNTNSTCATSAQNKHYNEDNLSGTLSLIGFGIGTAYKSTENYTVSKMARSPYKINRLRIGNYYNQIYLRPLRIAGRVILVAGVVGDLTNLSQTGDWQSALIGLGVTGITAINLPLGGFYFVVDETIGWDSVHQSIEKIDNFRQNYGYPLNGLR